MTAPRALVTIYSYGSITDLDFFLDLCQSNLKRPAMASLGTWGGGEALWLWSPSGQERIERAPVPDTLQINVFCD